MTTVTAHGATETLAPSGNLSHLSFPAELGETAVHLCSLHAPFLSTPEPTPKLAGDTSSPQNLSRQGNQGPP